MSECALVSYFGKATVNIRIKMDISAEDKNKKLRSAHTTELISEIYHGFSKRWLLTKSFSQETRMNKSRVLFLA